MKIRIFTKRYKWGMIVLIFALNVIMSSDSQNLFAITKSFDKGIASIDSTKSNDETVQQNEQQQQKLDKKMSIFPLDSASAANTKGC